MGSPLERHQQERRELFGTDAAAYEVGRPGYPRRVLDILRERCGLGPGSRVVEVGAGTGQATEMLLGAGAHVVAVELSPELAGQLESKHGATTLEIRVGAFEDQDLAAGSVDLVASATAFHWVPTQPGLDLCADILAEGGWLALWWTVYGDPERPDPFHEALQPVLQRLEPSLLEVPGAGNPFSGDVPYALDARARIDEIASSGRFGSVHHELIPWTGRHRPEELRALFATFSPWLALPPDRRQVALDGLEQLAFNDFGGVVERPYLTSVYVTQRT